MAINLASLKQQFVERRKRLPELVQKFDVALQKIAKPIERFRAKSGKALSFLRPESEEEALGQGLIRIGAKEEPQYVDIFGLTATKNVGPKISRQIKRAVERGVSKEGIQQILKKSETFFAPAKEKVSKALARLTAKTPQPQPQISPQAPSKVGKLFPLEKTKTSSYEASIDEVSKFYNTERLNIPDPAKRQIEEEISKQGELLGKTVGRKLSNKEVLDRAAVTGRILNQTITREQTKVKIAANLKLRQKLAAVARTGKVDKEFIDLWIKDKTAGEDIARQLQARVIIADPVDQPAIDAILDSIYKVNKNADEILEASKNVDFNDERQVTKFFRKFVKPKAEDWMDALRYNSMLSSPTTHLVNIASNYQGTGLLAPVEKTITGIYDAMRSALSGKPRQYLIGEGAAYTKGYYKRLGQAATKFWNIARGKEIASYVQATEFTEDVGKKIPLATSKIGRGVENILKMPSRLMEAADQFFTVLTESGLETAQKYRAGKGLKALPLSAKKEAAQRLFRGELGKNQGKILDALDYLPRKILEARNSENPVVRTIAKFTFPFIKTPINLFKQGIEYSPMGITTLWGATNKTEQLAKFTIGTASTIAVATLVSQDRLTFAEPTGEKQKAAFRGAGRQPYAVKIGNKWIGYSKLHPAIAFNFALVAAVREAIDKKGLKDDEAETVLSIASKYMNFLADQSYLKSMGDFVATTRGEAGALARYIGNYPNQFIPFRALMSYIERATDPVQRRIDPDGSAWQKQVQYIMSQIPGLAQLDLEIGGKRITPIKRRGPLGVPIENQNRLLNAVSPYRISTEKPLYEDIYQRNQAKTRLEQLKRKFRESLKIKL